MEYNMIDQSQDERNRYIHFAHRTGAHDWSVVQYGWQEPWKAYGYGPMVRDHYLIHFIKQGMGRLIVRDVEYSVREGECFMILPHQIAYYVADTENPWEYYWLGFEGTEADESVRACGFSLLQCAKRIPRAEDVFALLNLPRTFDLCAASGPILCGLCQQIMGLMAMFGNEGSKPLDQKNSGFLGNEYVRIVKSVIETSYQEQISVDALAKHMNLSRGYLTTLFKTHTGMSIKEYLLDFRLQQSILRLQCATYSIQRAALESGFTDPLYFSRMFKTRMGVSPSEYRKIKQDNG